MRTLTLQSTCWIIASAATILSCVVQSDPGSNQGGNSTMAVGGNSGSVTINAGSSGGGTGGGGVSNEMDAGSTMQPASGGHTAGGGRPSMGGGGAENTSTAGAGAGSGGTANAGGFGGASAGGCAEPAAMMGMTAAHNAVRAMVDPPNQMPLPALHWSCDVAAVAQAYADHLAQTNNCDLVHSMGQYGEPILVAGVRADATRCGRRLGE